MCMHIFDPLDSGEQWIENWKYRYTDASLARSKLYRSRGPKWHNDRDVTSFIYRRLPTKLVPQHSWFYVKHPIIQGLNLMRCAWHLTPCSIHFKKSPVWSYHPCPTHLVPMKNVLGSQKRYVNYPMPVVWKRVSHKRYLSSGRKTEKAPLERQVTFDPARIVPWESPAGSRKPTNQQQENTSSLRPKISPNIRNFSRSKCRMMRKNGMLQSLVTKQIRTKHGFFQ